MTAAPGFYTSELRNKMLREKRMACVDLLSASLKSSAFVLGCTVLVAGCGTASKSSEATPAQEAAAVARAPIVVVPPIAAKRVVLNMTGAKIVTEAKDWASFKEEWRATFADHAKEKGISFSMQEGNARPTGEAGTLLNVYVNDYRQVGIGARVFFGAMTGNAYIDAKVVFTDLNNGARFGDQAYNTSSSAWQGVFGKMTPQQVDAIAAGVFGSIAPR